MRIKLLVWRIIRALTSLALIIFLAMAIHAWLEVHQARNDAEVLLAEVGRLSPGVAKIADIQDILRRHKEHILLLPAWGPKGSRNFTIGYDNSPLSRLYLAPAVNFSVGFRVDDETLEMVAAGMTSGSSSRFFSHCEGRVVEFPQQAYPGQPAIRITRRNSRLSVELTTNATPDQRKEAYAFNLNCLERIGGCHSEMTLLPGAWQEYRRERGLRGARSPD